MPALRRIPVDDQHVIREIPAEGATERSVARLRLQFSVQSRRQPRRVERAERAAREVTLLRANKVP